MAKTTINMAPARFDLPFKQANLEHLKAIKAQVWNQEQKRLGEGKIYLRHESGMFRDKETGEMKLNSLMQEAYIYKTLADAISRAEEYARYHERRADEHGGLNLERCWEFGNAGWIKGNDSDPRSIAYGIRLECNDGSVFCFQFESWDKADIL